MSNTQDDFKGCGMFINDGKDAYYHYPSRISRDNITTKHPQSRIAILTETYNI